MSVLVAGRGMAALRAAARLKAPLALTAELGPEPWLDGSLAAPSSAAALVKSLYGAAPTLKPTRRAILLDRQLIELPIPPAKLLSLFPGSGMSLLQGWGRSRSRDMLKGMVGAGKEERSYRDWVEHRFGEAAYQLLFAPYAARRWGDGAQLNATLAAYHHHLPSESSVGLGVHPEAGFQVLQRSIPRVLGPGSWSLSWSESGEIQALTTEDGERLECSRLVWADELSALTSTLPEGPERDLLSWDSSQMSARHRILIKLPLESMPELPEELHIVDSPLQAWRVSFPAALREPCLLAAYSLPGDARIGRSSDEELVQDLLRRLPLPLPSASGPALVLRHPRSEPLWSGPWHPIQNRLILALEERAVYPAGSLATHRWQDPGQELVYLEGLASEEPDPHELQRVLLDPPILTQEETYSMGRFITR